MKHHKPILINMPVTLLRQLDHAAANMNLCRSEMLRRSLRRDLSFITKHELRHVDEARQNAIKDYSQWSSDNLVTTKE